MWLWLLINKDLPSNEITVRAAMRSTTVRLAGKYFRSGWFSTVADAILQVSSQFYSSIHVFSAAMSWTSSLKCSDMARDNTVLPATHTRTIPVFTLQLQSITDLWLVLIVPTHRGMARLSWPGWLVIYWDRFPALGVKPRNGHPSQY